MADENKGNGSGNETPPAPTTKRRGGNKGAMTVAEAGRKGGETVRDERGRGFYEEIGKKGGQTVKAERGSAFYEEIGKKGGEAVKAERGPGFFEEIGKKGGQKVRELIEEGKRANVPPAAPDRENK